MSIFQIPPQCPTVIQPNLPAYQAHHYPAFACNVFGIPVEVTPEGGDHPTRGRLWVDLSGKPYGRSLRVAGSIKLPNPASESQMNEITAIFVQLLTIFGSHVDYSSAALELIQDGSNPMSFVFGVLLPNNSLDLVFECKVMRKKCCNFCFFGIKRQIVIQWQIYIVSIIANPHSYTQDTVYFLNQFLLWITHYLS